MSHDGGLGARHVRPDLQSLSAGRGCAIQQTVVRIDYWWCHHACAQPATAAWACTGQAHGMPPPSQKTHAQAHKHARARTCSSSPDLASSSSAASCSATATSAASEPVSSLSSGARRAWSAPRLASSSGRLGVASSACGRKGAKEQQGRGHHCVCQPLGCLGVAGGGCQCVIARVCVWACKP